MATSFSDGRRRSTRREPPAMCKQLVNFISYNNGSKCYIEFLYGCLHVKSVWQKILSWTRWRQWIFYPISDVDVINKCWIWQPIILSVRFCIQCVLNDVLKWSCILNCNVLEFYSYKKLYKLYWQQYVHYKSSTYSEWRYFLLLINLQYEIKKNKK